jgi:phosphomannomutase
LEDAVYGGEMSAHYYFKDFAYCDSGMIPWLLVVESMCFKNQLLSKLVGERVSRYPVSGEINRKVSNPSEILAGIEYKEWRFNVRISNTEPLLRLNVESRGNVRLMKEKTEELLQFIDNFQASS